MNKRLQTLLRTLAEPGGTLSDADLEELRRIVEPEQQADDTERRPLWDFIRRGYAVSIFAARPNHVYPRDHLNTLVRAMDASVPEGSSVLGLLATRVTRGALVNAVAAHIGSEDQELRILATRLAGHCALLECGDAIAAKLRDESEQHLRMVSCEALGSMGYAGTAEAAAPFLDSQADDLWFDARAGVLLAGDVTPQFLRELLERGNTTSSMLVRFRDSFTRLAAQAKLERGAFAKALEDGGRGVRVCESVAAMAIATENVDLVEELLGDDDIDVRIAVALAAGEARASWATSALRQALSGEQDTRARIPLIATLSWLEPEPEAFLTRWLAGADAGDKVGAAWGVLGRTEFDALLTDVDTVDSDDLRVAIGCVLSTNAETSAENDVRCEYYWGRLTAAKWWQHTVPRRMAGAAGVGLPPAFAWFDMLNETRTRDDLEQAASFVRAHPTAAFGKMGNLSTRFTARKLTTCHGLANTPASRGHLEHRLLTVTAADELAQVFLELECCGGPQTEPGRLVAKSLATDAAMDLDAGELEAAAVIARSGAADARMSIIAALPPLGADVEPDLLALLLDSDAKIADAACDAVAALAQPVDAYLTAVKGVVAGQSAPAAAVPRLLAAASPKLRTALARTLDPAAERGALSVLAADDDRGVADAARDRLGQKLESRVVFLLRMAEGAKASANVESRIADHARGGAVLIAPGDYDLSAVWKRTEPHKTNDLPSDVEHGLCDAAKAFVYEQRRPLAKVLGVVNGQLNYVVGFSNVSVEALQNAVTALGDEPRDADILIKPTS
ncbi:MAG: hypothetical protein AAF721_19220 [Myxococcota bacterium]